MSDTPEPYAGLIQSLKIQAVFCERLGSPFSEAMLSLAAKDLEGGGPTRHLMRRWADTLAPVLFEDAVPIRLLGALHARALSGDDPELAHAYPAPDRVGDPEAAWRAALDAISAFPDFFERFMDHEPQTNEVRRSACLLPGFLEIARQTALPLRVFELGASAGLNQSWDCFHYDFGEAGSWGSSAAPVVIPSEWRGSPASFDTAVTVRERAACDRKPIDLDDPAARLRLRAYVWADQFDRLQRLDAAVALARKEGIRVEKEDALAWTERRVASLEGAATVIVHSVFWQYLPAETQQALEAALHRIGGSATNGAPFAWLRMEPQPNNMAMMELRLTLWPKGEERCLARVHPHGASIEWLG